MRSYIADLAARFKHAKNIRDFGKAIRWPQPPLAGRKAEIELKKMFNNWRAFMILRSIPRSEWPQMRLICIASQAIGNRRKFWGQNRKWLGDYLAIPNENSGYSNYGISVRNMKNADGFKNVVFSSFVKKFNKFNKMADRALILTETAIYKLDGARNKFKNMKRNISIKEVNINFTFYSHILVIS